LLDHYDKRLIAISIKKQFTIFLISALTSVAGAAQMKIITGSIMDSLTHIPLPNVTVCIKNMPRCVLTNNEGKFRISVDESARTITLTATGYHPASLLLTDSPQQRATVLMSKSYTALEEVIVSGKKKKYRNKKKIQFLF
jgi:hypothetical protein